jgi:hypothetical protein
MQLQINNPPTVVIDRLIGIQLRSMFQHRRYMKFHVSAHHKRVSLASKDLNLINGQWLDIGSFHLNYRHHVVVDGEHPIWLAGN